MFALPFAMTMPLQLTVRCKIRPGAFAAFTAAARACLHSARHRDPGTLQYDWFVDAEQSEAVVRETYVDSDALLAHIANLGDAFPALLATCELSIEIFGEPSPAVLEHAKGLPLRVYSFLQGI
jgi:quinol monooxygenase YgiN